MFSIIGTVEQGDRFDIGGRNGAGDWLEFCCVNGQRGWIYAPLLIVSEGPAPIRLAPKHSDPPSTYQHARAAPRYAHPCFTTVATGRPGRRHDSVGKSLFALQFR